LPYRRGKMKKIKLEKNEIFEVIHGAVATGEPLQDRESLRIFLKVIDKLEKISTGEGLERKLTTPTSLELEDTEFTFIQNSLNSLLRRAPRTIAKEINNAFTLLENSE
jgi:hypothetical protein